MTKWPSMPKWPQQGGRKGKNNQRKNKNKNEYTNDGDIRDGTDFDSSTISHSLRLSKFTQPRKGRGRQRGSRKRQRAGGSSNVGGKDKKIKEHLDERNYDSDLPIGTTLRDEPSWEEVPRGTSGSDRQQGTDVSIFTHSCTSQCPS